MKIDYNGEYPNLCSGKLIVTIEDGTWIFPDFCLHSGGSVTFDGQGSEHVAIGEWTIAEWPVGFPEDMKASVVSAINEQIPQGCCGGCI